MEKRTFSDPCPYLSGHEEVDIDDGGEGPVAVAYVVHDCEAPEECIRPGEPCPAKGPLQEDEEWLQAMEERLKKAKLFISGGMVDGT